jgi:hypothetical protein
MQSWHGFLRASSTLFYPKEKQIQRCSEILKSGWSLIGKSYGLMLT